MLTAAEEASDFTTDFTTRESRAALLRRLGDAGRLISLTQRPRDFNYRLRSLEQVLGGVNLDFSTFTAFTL